MGLAGHNGLDFHAETGTPIFAPMSGFAKVIREKGGYGNHIRIRSTGLESEIILGHLAEIKIEDGTKIKSGDIIGLSGNSGLSTGPHLHFGLRELEVRDGDVFSWQVKNYENGFRGYLDPTKKIITWKGGLEQTSFSKI